MKFAQGGVCGGKKSYKEEFQIVRKGDKFLIPGRTDGDGAAELAVSDELGVCHLTFSETINTIASGTPDLVTISLDLREGQGSVAGSGTFQDIDDDANEEGVARCTEPLTVSGSKR